jgi:hypothetical protein
MSTHRRNQLGYHSIACDFMEVAFGLEHSGSGPAQHHGAALPAFDPASDLAHPGGVRHPNLAIFGFPRCGRRRSERRTALATEFCGRDVLEPTRSARRSERSATFIAKLQPVRIFCFALTANHRVLIGPGAQLVEKGFDVFEAGARDPRFTPVTASNIPSQFRAEGGSRDAVKLMLPARSVIDRFVDRPQMRQLVHQSFEAVAPRMTADQDSLAIPQHHSTYAPPEGLLDDGLAHHIDLPSVGHRLRPDAGPGFPRQAGDILAPQRSFETSHRSLQNNFFTLPRQVSQAKLAMRAEAHEFETVVIRLAVEENEIGLNMAVARSIRPTAGDRNSRAGAAYQRRAD